MQNMIKKYKSTDTYKIVLVFKKNNHALKAKKQLYIWNKKKTKPEKNKTLVEIILLFQSFLFNYII